MAQMSVIVPVPASYEGAPPALDEIPRASMSAPLPRSVPTIKRITEGFVTAGEFNLKNGTEIWLGDLGMHAFRYTWEV